MHTCAHTHFFYYQELLSKMSQSASSWCRWSFLYLKDTDRIYAGLVYWNNLLSSCLSNMRYLVWLTNIHSAYLSPCCVPFLTQEQQFDGKMFQILVPTLGGRRTNMGVISCLWCHYILSQHSQTQLFLWSGWVSKWCYNTSLTVVSQQRRLRHPLSRLCSLPSHH